MYYDAHVYISSHSTKCVHPVVSSVLFSLSIFFCKHQIDFWYNIHILTIHMWYFNPYFLAHNSDSNSTQKLHILTPFWLNRNFALSFILDLQSEPWCNNYRVGNHFIVITSWANLKLKWLEFSFGFGYR